MTPARGRETPRSTASEKQEQAAIVELLRKVGAKVYVIGTTRPAGDFRGTCQTPGIPDIYSFLPIYKPLLDGWCAVWIEVKKRGGKMSTPQKEFRSFAAMSGHVHLVGGVDVVLAFLKERGLIR